MSHSKLLRPMILKYNGNYFVEYNNLIIINLLFCYYSRILCFWNTCKTLHSLKLHFSNNSNRSAYFSWNINACCLSCHSKWRSPWHGKVFCGAGDLIRQFRLTKDKKTPQYLLASMPLYTIQWSDENNLWSLMNLQQSIDFNCTIDSDCHHDLIVFRDHIALVTRMRRLIQHKIYEDSSNIFI